MQLEASKKLKKGYYTLRVRLLIGTASLVPAQPQRYQFGTSSPLLDARACARMRAYAHARENSIISEIPRYNRRGTPRPPAIIEFVSESDIFPLPAKLYSKSTMKDLPQVPFPSLRSSLEGGCSPHSCPPAFRGGLHSSNRSGCSAAVL